MIFLFPRWDMLIPWRVRILRVPTPVTWIPRQIFAKFWPEEDRGSEDGGWNLEFFSVDFSIGRSLEDVDLPFEKKRCSLSNWVFPKIGVPQNGWFMMENPIKIDDLGVPWFLETPNCL